MVPRLFWHRALHELSQKWRLICVVGPRQVGKTTFLKDQGNFFSFDDPKLRHQVAQDPVMWLQEECKKGQRIILDEATRLPELFEAMKIMADQFPHSKGKIWFASSSNYQLLRNIRESLAGRVYVYNVSPLLLSELSRCETPGFIQWLQQKKIGSMYVDKERLLGMALKRGLFPDPFLSPDAHFSQQWLEQYIGTYILQDLTQGFPKVDLSKWQSFMQLLLAYPACRISLNKIATTLGIHHATVNEYCTMAQAALLCQPLPVYSQSKVKRLTKGPKYILVDSALCIAHHESIDRGLLFENLVISQILHYLRANQISHRAFHWRTADDAEVDLVLEGDFGVVPIEIKASLTFQKSMTSGLDSFFEAHPKVDRGCIIYEGSKVIRYKNIDLLPVATLFTC